MKEWRQDTNPLFAGSPVLEPASCDIRYEQRRDLPGRPKRVSFLTAGGLNASRRRSQEITSHRTQYEKAAVMVFGSAGNLTRENFEIQSQTIYFELKMTGTYVSDQERFMH